nr:three-finger toxin MALT0070C-like [Misgurnus anguillicaudatus]
MDQHISILLLFIFITGAHSLKCQECSGPGPCQVKTCANGYSKCSTTTTVSGGLTSTSKSCSNTCQNQEVMTKITTKCCETDLCNGTDGLYKGSFILLLCPLFFLTLFH